MTGKYWSTWYRNWKCCCADAIIATKGHLWVLDTYVRVLCGSKSRLRHLLASTRERRNIAQVAVSHDRATQKMGRKKSTLPQITRTTRNNAKWKSVARRKRGPLSGLKLLQNKVCEGLDRPDKDTACSR